MIPNREYFLNARGWKPVVWSLAIVMVFFSLVFVAQRSDATDTSTLASPDSSTATRQVSGERLCRKARNIDNNPGRCARSETLRRGESQLVTGRMIAKYGDLVSPSGTTLREAAASPAPLYCRGWKQWRHGIYYFNWKEVHTGRFCYNGSDVWVAKDEGGYHLCDQGFGIGYDIKVTDCTENKIFVDTVPGYGYQNWDIFRVHAVWKGFPIYASYQMHANVYPSGNIYFYW